MHVADSGSDYGKVIPLGEKVFTETQKYAGRYVGNELSCANCHLDAGRRPASAPLWAAFIHYPAFRSKTGKVDTLASRIQRCCRFSMNGTAPPQDNEIMTALQTQNETAPLRPTTSAANKSTRRTACFATAPMARYSVRASSRYFRLYGVRSRST